MADGTYDTLAGVYDYLVLDALLSPRGSADAFAPYVAPGRAPRGAATRWPAACPERWEQPHRFEVAVVFVARDGAVQTHRERFEFWPFTEDELREDLRDAGLEPEAASVPADKAGRNLVTALRR